MAQNIKSIQLSVQMSPPLWILPQYLQTGSEASSAILPLFSIILYPCHFRQVSLYQWVSTRGHFVPLGDIWQCLEMLLIFTTGEEGLPWASNRQRPGMLLNNLQYTEQVPTTKNYQAQNVNNVAMNTTSTQILVSNKRNQRSLDKRLILDVGQEKYVI